MTNDRKKTGELPTEHAEYVHHFNTKLIPDGVVVMVISSGGNIHGTAILANTSRPATMDTAQSMALATGLGSAASDNGPLLMEIGRRQLLNVIDGIDTTAISGKGLVNVDTGEFTPYKEPTSN